MSPEAIISEHISILPRSGQYKELNRIYVELLELKAKVRNSRSYGDIEIPSLRLNLLATVYDSLRDLGRTPIDDYPVFKENHAGIPFSNFTGFNPGNILVYDISQLLIFEVVSDKEDRIICKRGSILVSENGDYLPDISMTTVTVLKQKFVGLVFPNLESLNSGLNNVSQNMLRQRRKMSLVEIDYLLDFIAHQYK